MLSTLRCGELFDVEKFYMRRNFRCTDILNVEKFLFIQFLLFGRKITFVAKYATLSRKLFCRDLLTFKWRQIEPIIMSVEKNYKYHV